MKSLGKFPNDMELEIFLSMLRANEIKYYRKGNFGGHIGINIGMIGEHEIFVDDENFDAADELLNEYGGNE